MKILFVLLLSFSSLAGISQSDSISLKAYCPTRISQEGGLCFAYAPVYTALSILHNTANGVDRENDPKFISFSYGFVASQVKKEKSFFVRLFDHCGKKGSADLALDVLLRIGTVPYSVFPENCDCGKVDGLNVSAMVYKIRDTSIIGNETTEDSTHIQRIRQALKNRNPVIITLYSEDFFATCNKCHSVPFPEGYTKNTLPANHDICIVGYNDSIDGGSFFVKNNFSNWGQNGFAYIRYQDMIKLIRRSYIIKI